MFELFQLASNVFAILVHEGLKLNMKYNERTKNGSINKIIENYQEFELALRKHLRSVFQTTRGFSFSALTRCSLSSFDEKSPCSSFIGSSAR